MNTAITLPITLHLPELKQALTGLGKLIGKTSTLPVLQSVRVHRDTQGMVTLEGTDLETHVTYRLKDTQAGQPLEVLVPFEALVKTAKGSGESLTLTPDGPDQVKLAYHIGTSPIEQRFTIQEMKEWPVTPKITATPVPLDPQFGVTLREVLQCVSDDSSRPVLRGACLDVSDPKAHYVVATNGRILFAANSFTFDLKASVIIPGSKFLAWSGFLSQGGCSLAVQNDPIDPKDPKSPPAGWVQLVTPRWTYTVRKIPGQYPNWKHALPTFTARETVLTLSPEAIRQIVEVAPQLPGGENINRPVRLWVENGRLHLAGRNKDEAWTRVMLDGVLVQGPDIAVGLNRDLLLQALRYGLNEIHLETTDGVALLTQGGRRCVIKLLTPPKSSNAESVPNAPASPVCPPTATTPLPSSSQQPPDTTTSMERKPMPKETKTTTPSETPDSLKLALERIEALRESLKNTLREAGEVLDAVKAADKERKLAARDVDSVRATLRSLQKVAL